MTDKITLSNVGSLIDATTAVGTINSNFQTIQTAFDNTLSRDGTTPNQMENNFDMNSKQILNLPAPATGNSPLRLQDLETFNGGGTISNLPAGGTINQVLSKNSNVDFDTGWKNSVTSVGLALPPDFTVTNSPVTTAGTLTGTWTTTPTGTGAVVRANTPTLVAPVLGTPTSVNLTNATNLPVSTGISGLATGISTFLATPTSANLKATVTDETGTGGSLVFATSPTLTTPTLTSPTLTTPALGVATGTSLALGGATIGSNALAVTGTSSLSGTTAINGTTSIANANTIALAVGPNGTTNPAFQVDASTASQAAGLKITGAVTGGTVAISSIDSGANNNLSIDAKGTGTVSINGTASGAIVLNRATTLSNPLTYGGTTLSNSVTGTGSMALSASPTFTGTPLSTTAAANTNTTQIATTAYVVGQVATATPIIDGTGAVGTSLLYARQDHVHPTDTSRQAADAQLFSNIPQNSQSAAYTLVSTDAEKHIFHPSADTTARTFTIPANSSVAYVIGTAITFINQNAAGTVTIAITTDTMRLAGAGTTGSRTLTANGVATAVKVTSTEWIISGVGLT